MQTQSKRLSKPEIRAFCRQERQNITDKATRDSSICDNILKSNIYQQAQLVLCYAALDKEINCDSVITTALRDNKKVAAPYCINENGEMCFYYINSIDDLEINHFGIREPNIDRCQKVTCYDNSIIIVPGFCFDRNGYRVGYGKGYYDRFLENYSFISIGLCYNSFVQDEIDYDRYDKSVDYIATETRVISCERGVHNG